MSTAHETRLTELSSRVFAIDADLKALDDQYIEIASRFDGSDSQSALKEADRIERRAAELRREKAMCLAAAGQVEQRRLQEQSEAEQAEKRKQQLEAKQPADRIMGLNVDADRHLEALVALLSQRGNALRALAATGVVPDTLTNRMQSKGVLTAAACAAGMHRHIDIHTVANASVRALADGNRVLLGIGIAPDNSERSETSEAPVARRQLRNGG
jgi:hypothetical protein